MQLTNFDILCAARRTFDRVCGVDVRRVEDVVDVRERRFLTATVLTCSGDFALTMTLTSDAAARLDCHRRSTVEADHRGARVAGHRGVEALVAELCRRLAAHLCVLIDSCGELFPPTLTEGDRYRINFPGMEISNQLTIEAAEEVAITVRLHARPRHAPIIDLRAYRRRPDGPRPIS